MSEIVKGDDRMTVLVKEVESRIDLLSAEVGRLKRRVRPLSENNRIDHLNWLSGEIEHMTFQIRMMAKD
jgi:hypothetical protein